MESLTTAVPTVANRAQRRAVQREQKKAAKKAAKKAIKLGLPVPVSTEIPVESAPITHNNNNNNDNNNNNTTITISNNTITPMTTLLKEVMDDKNAIHLHQESPSKRSSFLFDQVEFIPANIPTTSDVSTMHDDTIIELTDDSSSVIMDIPHIISTMSAHEEQVDDQEETTTLETNTDTDDGRTETLAPLLCPVDVTQPTLLSEHHRQNEENNKNDDDDTKQVEEEIISDTTSVTIKPSSFLSSPNYSLDDIKQPLTEHHAVSSADNGHHSHQHPNRNSANINNIEFLGKQSSTETLVLKTKAKKFHKVILTSLKKKKAAKKEKDPKTNKKAPPTVSSNKKSWQFWKKNSDKMVIA